MAFNREVKRVWTVVGLAVVVIVVLLVLAVTSGSGGGAPSGQPLMLTEPVSADDWTTGATSSPISLVEYSDFQCPACASYAPVVKQLLADYGDRISFTYRHYPLRANHANAQLAAQAAEAAGRQGRFWELADLLFANQADWSESARARDRFLAYAKQLGLNPDQFERDLDSREAVQAVNDDFETGTKAGISHTPTFFLNGLEVVNPGSYNEFANLIEQLLNDEQPTATTTS